MYSGLYFLHAARLPNVAYCTRPILPTAARGRQAQLQVAAGPSLMFLYEHMNLTCTKAMCMRNLDAYAQWHARCEHASRHIDM